MRQVDIDGGVAVGVEGSPSSLRALVVAGSEARRRDAVLHVIRAWTMRTAPRPADYPVGAVPSADEFEEAARDEVRRLVETKLGDDPGCSVHVHACHAPAPQVLLSASRGAELLVVGHRGRGGFAGLLLGSVAEQCVRHAACPVLVVRPNI